MKITKCVVAVLSVLPLSVSPAIAKETIKVGAILVVTGPAAFVGTPESKTLGMLADQINAQGGIGGNKIQLIIKDSGASPEKAISFAKQLIEKQIGMDVPLFQSHGFGNIKYVKAAGAATEGIIFPAGRLLVSGVLPDGHPQKAVLVKYKKDYESKFNEEVSTFGGHSYDAFMILVRAIREAGTDKEKVRETIENMKNFVGTGGVFNFTPEDHNGLEMDAFEMLTVKDGKFALLGM